MRIEKLEIEGFRSLRKVSWQPGALNIIIGPNGSGKSNLLHLLELISASANGRLGDYIQNWGGMDPLVWDGKMDSITSRISTIPSNDETNGIDHMVYDFEINRIGLSSAYRVGSEMLVNNYIVKSGRRNNPYELIKRRDSNGAINDDLNIGLVDVKDDIPEEETLLSLNNPFLINDLIPRFRRELVSWKIYHDVRVDRDAQIRRAAVTRAEKVLDSDGQNLIHILHTLCSSDRKFEENINDAMRVAFGDDFDKLVFPPDADQRIQLRLRWKSLKREVSALDISDGTLRFLFLLAALANPNPPALIAIDEPEYGLHPSMLPIIAEFAAEAATRTQVIISTHSAQLLDAFTKFSPTITVAKCEEGETILTQVNEVQLEYWLKTYTLGSMYRSGQLEDM